MIAAVYVFAVAAPDGDRVVLDDLGRVVGAQTRPVAQAFANALEARGVERVQIAARRPGQVRAMLLAAGTPPEKVAGAFTTIEGEAISLQDAMRWARELANRVPVEPGYEARA